MHVVARWMALLGLAVAVPAIAGAATPQEIAAQRRELLEGILRDSPTYSVESARAGCAAGNEPGVVRARRGDGAAYFPDAADTCVAALIRLAREKRLQGFYETLWKKLDGAGEGPAGFPRAIGVAVLQNRTRVAIGGGRAAVIPPALAFDAGFTVATAEGRPGAAPANIPPLRAVAEACLDQRQDPATCFSAGYSYGAMVNGGWSVLDASQAP